MTDRAKYIREWQRKRRKTANIKTLSIEVTEKQMAILKERARQEGLPLVKSVKKELLLED